MATTGFYFQAARGRAMVRKNAMRKARQLKRQLQKDRAVLRQIQIETREWEILLQVRRARQAHKAWRAYRKLHLEVEVDNDA